MQAIKPTTAKGTVSAKRSVLLVEDNPDHAELALRQLRKQDLIGAVKLASDGEKALSMIFNPPGKSDPWLPDLILLDLRLPKIDGLEVLRRIRAREETLEIPVVILTSSSAESDMLKAYESIITSYLVKPMDLQNFSMLFKNIPGFNTASTSSSADTESL